MTAICVTRRWHRRAHAVTEDVRYSVCLAGFHLQWTVRNIEFILKEFLLPEKTMKVVTDLNRTKESLNGKADELTQQNVQTILELEKAAKEERTRSDRVAEVIANFCGSMVFVWVHVIWFSGWILLNVVPGAPHVDPFPFTFLTLVVSLEAIFLSTFILISQNHDARISERRNHLDLQVDLLSEQENTQMIAMLRAIAEKLEIDLSQDHRLEALSEHVEPQRLAKQIEAHDNG